MEKIKRSSFNIRLLTWMHQNKADYTNTFCFLMNKKINKISLSNENFYLEKKMAERLK